MERFGCRTMVVSGAGALEMLAKQNCRRLLVVTAPDLPEQILHRIRHAAGEAEFRHFEDAFPSGTMKRAVEGSRVAASFQPDLVAAVGDAAVLDLAKAMVCFSRHPCILAVIPTSFAAENAVTNQVTLRHNGRWHQLQDKAMEPNLAILEEDLAAGRSREETAEEGFSMLAAALEAYSTTGGGMLRDLHAREGFASGWAALPAAAAGKSPARKRLMTAAVLTGMALDQGPGLCGAMISSLNLVFGLSPGKAAGILLPAIIGCNAHAAGRRYAELSRAAGLGGSREEIGIRNLRTGLIHLRRELGLPGTLVQAGVDLRSVWNCGRKVVELTLENNACRNNPVAVDDFLVRRILEEITGRF